LHINGINRSFYAPSINRKINFIIHLLIHQAIVVGIVLAAIGGSNLAKPASSSNNLSTAATLVKVGYIVLLLVLVKLAIYAIFVRQRLSRPTEAQNNKTSVLPLVYWTLLAMVFVAVRVIYGLVFAFDRSPKLSPYSGGFAIKFILIFLVQLLAALCLVVGGLVTKNIDC
jgi:heme/copper-type cytochrome/quinol oxidase subunit 2